MNTKQAVLEWRRPCETKTGDSRHIEREKLRHRRRDTEKAKTRGKVGRAERPRQIQSYNYGTNNLTKRTKRVKI